MTRTAAQRIPYNGKLSREKSFVNFTVLCVFAKVFSTKFWGWGPLAWQKWAIHKNLPLSGRCGSRLCVSMIDCVVSWMLVNSENVEIFNKIKKGVCERQLTFWLLSPCVSGCAILLTPRRSWIVSDGFLTSRREAFGLGSYFSCSLR